MTVRLAVAVTDKDWFDFLRVRRELSEINFWAPGAAPFKALQPGELFLFKLHSPLNFIVGGGVFAYANSIPCSLAWEAFGASNGAVSLAEMRQRIAKYRRADTVDRSDFVIGCRILTQPFFLPEAEWIPIPASWSPNIVTFKTYDTSESDGLALWNSIQERMARTAIPLFSPNQQDRYGNPILVSTPPGTGNVPRYGDRRIQAQMRNHGRANIART